MERDDERAGRRDPDREDLRDEEELRVQRTEEVGLPSLHGLFAFKPRHLLSV